MTNRRESPRLRQDVACTLSIEGRIVQARLLNLSEVGALFRISSPDTEPVSDRDLGLDATFTLHTVSPARRYTGEIIRRYILREAHHIALRFWEPCEELSR